MLFKCKPTVLCNKKLSVDIWLQVQNRAMVLRNLYYFHKLIEHCNVNKKNVTFISAYTHIIIKKVIILIMLKYISIGYINT